MATDLQLMYLQERAGWKCGHGAALRRIARRTGLDTATVARCLHGARRADEQDAKRAAKEAAVTPARTSSDTVGMTGSFAVAPTHRATDSHER